ncbi:MAG: UDP-N-acetylmuramoyl-L-alanine--D-glutamate ligase [Ahrensia sp.]
MIPVTHMAGKNVAVFGLGGSGLSTALALKAGGAHVQAWDDNPDRVAATAAAGVPTSDLHDADWSSFGSFVLSPGVPLTHPEPHWTVKKAHEAGVEIIGDLELFARERARWSVETTLIAITGTNGKSTTTALTAHILREAGLPVAVGGNIGTPVLELAMPKAGTFFVIECSSYQIDLAPSLRPSVGLLLNVTPDHLDRHGTIENYAAIKARLVERADQAVIGIDDTYCAAIAARIEDAVTVRVARDRTMIDLSDAASLRGDHNVQNALMAMHACRLSGLTPAQITTGFNTFPGLAHRMQIVAERDGVQFINDSKATNADAAEKSLTSFARIRWIAGGLAKEGGITALRPHFSRIAKAYLIGEAAPAFAATLGDDVPYEISATIDRAVAHAARDAQPGDAVLLAPAAASFDQFANFEKRGEAFVAAVQALDHASAGETA